MRELILTGLQDFWPEDPSNAVFLNGWCFARTPRFNFLEHEKYSIVSSPWKTPDDIFLSAKYVDAIFDRIIPALSRVMNLFHDVNHSQDFWRKYLCVWLLHWLGSGYDRFRRLEVFSHELTEPVVVKILNRNQLPKINDLNAFFCKIVESHLLNCILCSDIIQTTKFSNFVVCESDHLFPRDEERFESVGKNQKFASGACEGGLLDRISRKLRDFLDEFLSKSKLLVGLVQGKTKWDQLYIQLRIDPFFPLRKSCSELQQITRSRKDLESLDFRFGADNEFERYVERSLLKWLPDSYLTMYYRNGGKKPPTKIWIGYDVWTSEKATYQIADICERGGRWISCQHGGGYGQTHVFPIGKIEYEIAGDFITWGWNHQHEYPSRYHPMPSPFLSKLPKHILPGDRLIFVSSMETPYPNRFYTDMRPGGVLKYLKDQGTFFEYLRENIRKKILYKKYPRNYGIGEKEFIERYLEPDQFVRQNFLSELQHSKLVIIDHRSTTFLMTLAMNIPTIIYWSPESYSLTPAVKPYFARLQKVGIFHSDPASAAKAVNDLWDRVQDWWGQSDVQQEKKLFCKMFARTSPRWKQEWVRAIRRLMKTCPAGK